MEVLSSELFHRAQQDLKLAVAADCQQRYQEATSLYMKGGQTLLAVAEGNRTDRDMRLLIKDKCQDYYNRIKAIKEALESATDVPPLKVAVGDWTGVNDDSAKDIKSWMQSSESCLWCECQGAVPAKEFLWTNVVQPLLHPGLPDKVSRVKKGILLYGLPGTGKTLLLRAVASSVGCPVLRIPSSDLLMMRDNPDVVAQRVKSVFTWALRNSPCIVCLDDLECLCARDKERADSKVVAVREQLISSLMDMPPSSKVIVLGATLSPWLLSGTLRRRFDRRFYLSLPNAAERSQIFLQHLDTAQHSLSQDDLDCVGERTEGFSGSDVVVLAKSCLMCGIRILQKATHYRKIVSKSKEGGREVDCEMMSPCHQSEPGAIEITFEFLNPDRIHVPALTMEGVEKELQAARPSCGEAEISQMNSWREEFGQEMD